MTDGVAFKSAAYLVVSRTIPSNCQAHLAYFMCMDSSCTISVNRPFDRGDDESQILNRNRLELHNATFTIPFSLKSIFHGT